MYSTEYGISYTTWDRGNGTGLASVRTAGEPGRGALPRHRQRDALPAQLTVQSGRCEAGVCAELVPQNDHIRRRGCGLWQRLPDHFQIFGV